MKQFSRYLSYILLILALVMNNIAQAQTHDMSSLNVADSEDKSTTVESHEEPIDVKKIIFEHLGNSYEWHIGNIGGKDLHIPLPVMVYSNISGWHFFSSDKLHENAGQYEGLYIAPESSIYSGRLVETDKDGNEVRPWDFSLTRVAVAIIINSLVLLLIVLFVARWYRKPENEKSAPGGFVGLMEILITAINEDVIKQCVGPKYRKFSPYLLTAFFFILINNLMGLVPFFPGGTNVTGNITITFFLAVCTFLVVNIFGTKAYWKEILWPEVPWWLKFPIPMMPAIELMGIFTKPFALMVRLFANMLAGHIAMLVLTCLVFITASMGVAINASMSVTSVLFNIFMNMLELLVAFIQAYVFTMLSAVFIGLAMAEHHE